MLGSDGETTGGCLAPGLPGTLVQSHLSVPGTREHPGASQNMKYRGLFKTPCNPSQNWGLTISDLPKIHLLVKLLITLEEGL